jgi:hypothetical protein
MLWIDSTDLKTWAKRRDCQGNLPFLVRSLIRATAPDISKILFPAGDNVSSPGLDGILEVSEGNEYIPEGFSIWEMGCNKDVKGKANKDYEKRKKNLTDIDPSETTYVFVSPRAWTKNEEWCKEKKEEGFWRDVKAYNAAKLEEWIEQAPAVGIWLGQYLGKYPKGVKALTDWWDEWNMSTNPNLTAELVLAGRAEQIANIQEKLKFPSSKITVQAATINESIAFLAAVINSLPEEEREFYLSRSIVINDSEAFKHISVTGKSGLLLIPEFEIEGVSVAIQKGHSIYIPVGPDNNIASPEIVLPRMGRNAFISALEEMGLSNEDSQRYSRDTGRSLTVLRRKLMDHANHPEWAKADSARYIIPALLVGRWIESNDTDKEIISQIARDSYDSFSTKLYSWRNQPDSPVLKIGELWRLVSAMDAFFLLAPSITSSDLQQFKNIVFKVFKTLDPALELEPGERWLAAVHGKVQPYSHELREGILQTLILIAVFGDTAKMSLSTSPQTWVDNIVRELLHGAECNLWMSLDDVLPIIAEASPKSFMDAVNSSLSGDEKPIMCLFEEIQGFTGPSSNHSSLLWALEHLSWSPELLPRVTLILGKLAKHDPNSESRMINRPKNSLRDIFLLWNPQTYTSLEKRLEILDLLIEKYPEVGWNLLIDLMPKDHDTVDIKPKTIWREFSEKSKSQVTITEYYTSVKEIINRLLIHVGYIGQRWVNLLDNFPVLPVDERNKVIEQFSSDVNEISDGRNELWNELRKIISKHRSYPDADWALPEEELQGLEEIYLSLEPDDTINRLCWLFDGWPDLLEGVKIEDRHDDDKHFVKLRVMALNEIRAEQGFKGIIRLAEKIEHPIYLGNTLAEVDITSIEEEKLYSLLEENDEFQMIFVKQYIFLKSFKDKDWIKNLVEKAQTESWSDLKIVNCFTAFPSRMFVWNLLNSFDEDIQRAYWKKCGFGGITRESEDKIYYVKQMVQVKRYYKALGIASLFAKEMPTELIAELLKKTANEKSEDEYGIKPWDIEKLFEGLYKSEYPKSEIAKLELLYIPILASVGSRRAPKMLHSELANDPNFFAEIMRYIYKRKDGKQDEGEENITQKQLEQRGNLFWRLMKSWKTIPGSENNGQINYEKLKSWVDEARELCEKSDRIEFCDVQIGELLAYAEPEGDVWPPEAVCKIIENIESDDLHSGFGIGTENKRGTTTRALDEGGKQEVVLADKFRGYAENLNTRFPKTASILNNIAEDYENQAKKEDEEVEKRDLDY